VSIAFGLVIASLTLQYHENYLQIAKPKNEEFMNNAKRPIQWWSGVFISATAALILVGCQSSKGPPGKITMTPPAGVAVVAAPVAATTPTATATPAAAAPAAVNPTSVQTAIRIDAGAAAAYTNSVGEVWLADQGFADGDTTERSSDLQIANTKDPAIYRSEHYGMTSFSCKLPDGKYTVKLHFAETYEEITGPGQRVFSFNVGGQEFKAFDVFVKAGGANRAYVETANANVTDGKLDITFTSDVQSPEINGIEIIPNP